MEMMMKVEEEVMLPGFRFHPTDEELVGFYLQRKVEKKPISIELIKQIDIYKYDPWDLPKVSNVGEREWYFFCKRGRKYRNSIRPNRVTSSGFWKATGIDKPIFSNQNQECIGLKKSLVYYKGNAGKGTKTDWMMHEFRLPLNSTNHIAQDAEVWTLCRILKRIPSYRKYTPTNSTNNINNSNPSPSSTFQSADNSKQHHDQTKKMVNNFYHENDDVPNPNRSFFNGVNGGGEDDVFSNGSWDELSPVLQTFAIDSSKVYGCI